MFLQAIKKDVVFVHYSIIVENAYSFSNQYMFGPDMLVSPVTQPMNKDAKEGNALFATQKIWLPEGEWNEWNSGTLIKGNQVVERPFMLDEIPVYVRSGAIIPMQPKMRRIGEKAIDPLIINVFPGQSGTTKIYDDAGDDPEYKNNKYTYTTINFKKQNSTVKVSILPIEDNFEGRPDSRSYEIRLPLTFVPLAVKINGKSISYSKEDIASKW